SRSPGNEDGASMIDRSRPWTLPISTVVLVPLLLAFGSSADTFARASGGTATSLSQTVESRSPMEEAIEAAVAASGTDLTGGGPSRGPTVVVPDCTIEDSGCHLDPSTPDMNPGACAVTLSELLQRRGIRTLRSAGPAAKACATDPNSIVVLTTFRAVCPVKDSEALPRRSVVRTRLSAEITVRDCASGEVVGHGRTERAIEWGRRRVLSDG